MLAFPHRGLRWESRQITSPGSPWNAPLAPDAPLTGEQHDLAEQAQRAAPAVNAAKWSCRVDVLPAAHPLTPVELMRPAWNGVVPPYAQALAAVLKAGVPIPPGWEPQDDSDRSACFYQPDLDRLFELWRLTPTSAGWTCEWGGRMSGVASNPGHFVDRCTTWRDRTYPALPNDPALAAVYEEKGWGSTATSLPLAAGILTAEDAELGVVQHALGLAVITPRKGVWRAPAQRGDGWVADAPVIEGMRFRLPADHEPGCAHPTGRLVEQAARDYGLIVWDKAGALSVRAEPSVAGGWQALQGFPWAALEVLV